MKTFSITSLSLSFLLFIIYNIAIITFPLLNDENYFKLTFGFKHEKYHKMPYRLLFNSCTNEYKVDLDNGSGLNIGYDIYGGIQYVMSSTIDDATRFKDSLEAKRCVFAYFYYQHQHDSIALKRADEYMSEYNKEQLLKHKHIDNCKNNFKTLTPIR